MENNSLNERVLKRLEEKIAVEEFMTSEVKSNIKVKSKKSNKFIKVASIFIIPIIAGNAYTYATYNQNIFSYVLDKIGIFTDNEGITQLNETKNAENSLSSKNTLTLESYGIDENTLIISYRCKLAEEYDYFLENLIDYTKIVDGDKEYILEDSGRAMFYKISNTEYEIFKIYDVNTKNLSNNAKCESILKIYKEPDGPNMDVIGNWEFEFDLDKEKSKISNEKYILKNKKTKLISLEEPNDMLTEEVELLEVHKSDMVTKLVLFLGGYYATDPSTEYTVEILGENDEVILANNIQSIVGGVTGTIITKPLENNHKIKINIYHQGYRDGVPTEVYSQGTIELDLDNDLISKTEQENANYRFQVWNDLEFNYNSKILEFEYPARIIDGVETIDEERSKNFVSFDIFKEVGNEKFYSDSIQALRTENLFNNDLETIAKEEQMLQLAGGYELNTNYDVQIVKDQIHGEVIDEVNLTHNQLMELVENGIVNVDDRIITTNDVHFQDMEFREIKNIKINDVEAITWTTVYGGDYAESQNYIFVYNNNIYKIKTPVLTFENEDVITEFIENIKIL